MLTVLIVEDEADILSLAENALGVAGYRTFAARDANAALAALRDHPEIDLLFADTSIGGPASGFGLARTAARMRPDIKVLYATYRPDELMHLESPMDPAQILRKPYQPAELQRAVGWLLQASA
jgi:two-component system, response regulator PdtaR